MKLPTWSQVLGLALVASAFSFSVPATAGTKYVNGPFVFELHTAEIDKWRRGDRPTGDEMGDMAWSLKRRITDANSSVDMAIYGVSRQNWVFDAIRSQRQTGVRMRAVVDQTKGEFGDWRAPNFMYQDTAQLPNVLSRRNIIPDLNPDGTARNGTIMHNKFVVIDRRTLWMGTTNLSFTGVGGEYNANTSLTIFDRNLSQRYTQEFEQMFSNRRFSIYKQRLPGYSRFVYNDGTSVDTYFAPQDDSIDRALIPFIDSTRHSLDVGIFFLTSTDVADAIGRAVRRGVRVRIIHDALGAGHPSNLVDKLRRSGVTVMVEHWGGKMHMKTAVADGRHTLIGSMNWSLAGSERNDENTLVIRNNRRLAQGLTRYFNDLWDDVVTRQELTESLIDPIPEGPSSPGSCSDGIDNDEDGLLDELDPDCGR